jgi:hypothetical protein
MESKAIDEVPQLTQSEKEYIKYVSILEDADETIDWLNNCSKKRQKIRDRRDTIDTLFSISGRPLHVRDEIYITHTLMSSCWTIMCSFKIRKLVAERVIQYLHNSEDFRILFRLYSNQLQHKEFVLNKMESWEEINMYYNIASHDVNEIASFNFNELYKIFKSKPLSWMEMFKMNKDIVECVLHEKSS